MTKSKQPNGDEPKRKSLKLLLRSKPVAEVETSIGRIYLYPLRVRDMTDFEKLEPAEAIDQTRNFLTSIGSLALESDETPERIPLDPEIAKTLSDDEVELRQFLQRVEDETEFTAWYFGHFHEDTDVEGQFFCLYEEIVELEQE